MSTKKWTFWRLGMVFVILLLTCIVSYPVTGQAKVFKWKCQTFLPPGNVQNKMIESFFEEIRKFTNGEVDITVFPVGALVPNIEIADATRRGVIQVGYTCPAYDVKKVPVLRFIFGIPAFDLTHSDINTIVFSYGLEQLVKKEVLKKLNLYYFSEFIMPAALITRDRPIKSIKDMEGLKVRTTGALADWFKEMGAAPVYMSGADLYMALSTGTIDAAHWGGLEGSVGPKLNEVCKYFVTPYISLGVQDAFYINKKAFDSLPRIYQEYIRRLLLEKVLLMTKQGIDWERKFKKVWQNSATESHINIDDQKKMTDLGMKIMKNYVQDEATKKAYRMFEEFRQDKKSLPY